MNAPLASVDAGGGGPCAVCPKHSVCRSPCERLEALLEPPVHPRRDLPLFEHRHAPPANDDRPGPWSRRVAREAPRLRSLVAGLPSEEAVVLGRELEGLAPATIARLTGRSVRSVGRAREHGIALLRAALLAESTPVPPDRTAPLASHLTTTPEETPMSRPAPVDRNDTRAAVAKPSRALKVRATPPPPRALPTPDHDGAAALFAATERVFLAEINPALALALLERNVANRSLSQERVDAWARDMLEGAWCANNQGLALGADGTLYDGQHRLRAVVQSGATVRMVVVRGLDAAVRATIDQGRVRSISDTLRVVDGEQGGARAVAWIRAIEALHGRSPRVISPHAARVHLAHYRASIDWMLANGPRSPTLRRASVLGPLVYAHHALGAAVEPLLEGYTRGADLATGSPALALRTYVMDRSYAKAERDRLTGLRALRCAVAQLRGERVDRIPATEEAYQYLRRLELAQANTPTAG